MFCDVDVTGMKNFKYFKPSINCSCKFFKIRKTATNRDERSIFLRQRNLFKQYRSSSTFLKTVINIVKMI